MDERIRGRRIYVTSEQVAQKFGVHTRIDALEMSLRTMVEDYNRLVGSLPERSPLRGMVEGMFGKAPEVAKQILETR